MYRLMRDNVPSSSGETTIIGTTITNKLGAMGDSDVKHLFSTIDTTLKLTSCGACRKQYTVLLRGRTTLTGHRKGVPARLFFGRRIIRARGNDIAFFSPTPL